MKKRLNYLIFLTITLLISMPVGAASKSLPSRPQASSQKAASYSSDEIIVKLKKGYTISELKKQGIHSQATESDIVTTNKIFMKQLSPQESIKKLESLTAQSSGTKKIRLQKTLKHQHELLEHIKARDKRRPKNAVIPELENIYRIKVKSGQDILQLTQKYMTNPIVEYAEPNFFCKATNLPNDYWVDEDQNNNWDYWNEHAREYMWNLKKIGMQSVWNQFGYSPGAGIIVAVVDSGIRVDHVDIQANLWTNDAELNGTDTIDDDDNGFVDDQIGYNFVNDNGYPFDYYVHGTHVSGTIAAIGNNIKGLIGVAAGSKIMTVKALDDAGNGNDTDVANAIYYAVNNGADVINCSLEGPNSQLEIDAVNYAVAHGVVVVAAAGNDNDNVADYCPANIANAITVGASDQNDQRCSFSNYGNKIDIAAPGQGIISLGITSTNTYEIMDGTSMAAPHVAALAALILQQHPSFTPDEVKNVIRNTADDIMTPGFDVYSGYGRINVVRALDSTPPTTPSINDEGFFTTNNSILHVSWSSTDNESEIIEYQYALGTTQGGTQALSWTVTSNLNGITINGLALQNRQNYYLSAKARNAAGMWSDTGYSDGIYFNRIPSISVPALITANETETVSINPLYSDPDGDTLSVSYSGWMTTSSYQTTYNDAGTHNVLLTIDDNYGGIVTRSILVAVYDIVVTANHIPSVSVPAIITADEGALVSINPVCSDPDGDTLSVSYSGWMTTSSYQTTYNDAGTHNVLLTIDDNYGGLVTRSILVVISNINRIPSVSVPALITANETETIAINPLYSDPDGDTLSVSYSGWMTTSSYQTTYNDAGTHNVLLTVYDNYGGLVTRSILVVIGSINRIPSVSIAALITANETETVSINPLCSDPDGDTLSVSYSGWMTSSSYQTTYNDAGTHNVLLTVNDDHGGIITRSILVVITNINRIPSIQ
ncbi:MAG: hypothetical protein A2X43_04800 [Candidatus Margulisbacteria bacterium GWD2_39_127]|nr:MAG: hypothetical protein A2X43_04800 [Candidatus Margulisbacteria bacterium GWD2_39_127]